MLNGDDNAYPIPSYMSERGRVLLSFLKDGNQGRKNRTNNYSPGGYLNKKGTDPNMVMGKVPTAQYIRGLSSVWPIWAMPRHAWRRANWMPPRLT